MTQWAVIVPTSSPLRVGAVGAFIEEGQISHEPPPDIRVGDGGYLSFQDNSRGSFTVEDVHDGEILLLEKDTGLRWALSPANEEEKCKIWYSICRTMSDCDVLCGNVNDRSVRAIAVKPRAFGAPLCGVGDLTARRGRANEATRAANADLHARCTARWSDIVR